MKDSIKVKIGDSSVEFGFIGRSFRLSCVAKIREHRHNSFKQAIGNMPSDPVSVASQMSSAIDAHMSGVIVDDQDVNSWLSTPEGFFYTFSESLKKKDADVSEDKVLDLHDRLSDEGMGKLRDFWGRSLNGSRYDDILDRIYKQVRKDAIAYYEADEAELAAFEDYLKNGKTATKEKPAKKPADAGLSLGEEAPVEA